MQSPNAGTIPSADTFTASFTYRHFVAPSNKDHAVALMIGSKEVVAFRAFEDKSWLGNAIPDGATVLGNWEASDINYGMATITKDFVDAMIAQQWITISLKVEAGVPVKVTFSTDGLEDLSFDYHGGGSFSGLNAKDTTLRFRGSSVELKEITIDGVVVPNLETPNLPVAPGTLLYSMTYDNSGDEADRVADWNFQSTTSLTDGGYLSIPSSNGWAAISYKGAAIKAATTFTTQVTYRYTDPDALFTIDIGVPAIWVINF